MQLGCLGWGPQAIYHSSTGTVVITVQRWPWCRWTDKKALSLSALFGDEILNLATHSWRRELSSPNKSLREQAYSAMLPAGSCR